MGCNPIVTYAAGLPSVQPVFRHWDLTQGKAGADSFEQALSCVAKATHKGVVAFSQSV
jgi:hypothetical protein